MNLQTLVALVPMLVAVSCSSLKRPEPPGSGAVPIEARPEDIAKVDEFFNQGGKFGFHPGPESPHEFTPENSGYVVELDQQRVYFYHGSELVAASKLASGRPGYRTETGEYRIGQKNLNHRSNLYGNFVNSKGGTLVSDVTAGFDPTPVGGRFQGSLMKYFQRFDRAGRGPTAMGFHQGVVPGTPVSHGCVRLPGSMAAWFFKSVPSGTRVVIRGSKYGVPPGTKQKRARRAPKVHSSLKELQPAPEPQVPPAGAEDAVPPAAGGSGPGEPPAPAVPEAVPPPAAPDPLPPGSGV
jgi:lipoprotein-anchoring transpeptidase ErfK/SrfK